MSESYFLKLLSSYFYSTLELLKSYFWLLNYLIAILELWNTKKCSIFWRFCSQQNCTNISSISFAIIHFFLAYEYNYSGLSIKLSSIFIFFQVFALFNPRIGGRSAGRKGRIWPWLVNTEDFQSLEASQASFGGTK